MSVTALLVALGKRQHDVEQHIGPGLESAGAVYSAGLWLMPSCSG